MGFTKCPASRQPSLEDCEQEQADTRPYHSTRALRHPSIEEYIVDSQYIEPPAVKSRTPGTTRYRLS
jgi:hypothetical protein